MDISDPDDNEVEVSVKEIISGMIKRDATERSKLQEVRDQIRVQQIKLGEATVKLITQERNNETQKYEEDMKALREEKSNADLLVKSLEEEKNKSEEKVKILEEEKKQLEEKVRISEEEKNKSEEEVKSLQMKKNDLEENNTKLIKTVKDIREFIGKAQKK